MKLSSNATPVVIAALTGFSWPAETFAAVQNVTPANIEAAFANAKGGDTLVLAAGEYVNIRLGKRTFSPDLVIDAHAATISGISLGRVEGVAIHGGTMRLPPAVLNPKTGENMLGYALRLDNVTKITMSDGKFVGPGRADAATSGVYGDGYGIFVRTGRDVDVENNSFFGLKVGVVLSYVEGFKIAGNTVAANRSDGFDFDESRKGLVENNTCSGTIIRDQEHPDCIQLWSRPATPPVADIVIRKNKVRGDTQGISGFNHVREGVDDGGFDRITVEDNDLEVSYVHGITLVNSRNSVVRNNHVKTAPGAKRQARIDLDPGNVRCGNTVDAGAGRTKIVDPPCQAQ